MNYYKISDYYYHSLNDGKWALVQVMTVSEGVYDTVIINNMIFQNGQMLVLES